jgi:hypothetical protein
MPSGNSDNGLSGCRESLSDPTRLPPAATWRERYEREYALPIERRAAFMVSWLDGGRLIGFSTADKIVF